MKMILFHICLHITPIFLSGHTTISHERYDIKIKQIAALFYFILLKNEILMPILMEAIQTSSIERIYKMILLHQNKFPLPVLE